MANLLVNYTKQQYLGKIQELEGYVKQLNDHLDTMEKLKEQMYQFWDDDNAREVGKTLALEIQEVRNAQDRTTEMLTFYKKSVEKLEGANVGTANLIKDAISIISKL